MIDAIIRTAKDDDLEVVLDLSDELAISDLPYDKDVNIRWAHSSAGKKYYKDKISGKDGICFVAVMNDAIVGYVVGVMKKPSSWRNIKLAELENLYVIASHRNRGVGKKLTDAFISWAKNMHANRIVVSSFYGNEKAINFYKRKLFIPYDINLELPT